MRKSTFAVPVGVTSLIVFVAFGTVDAQLPGTPVLQNAWASPGIVVALDVGGGSGASSGGATYAGAAAWAPGAARFQLSGGAGMNTSSGKSRAVYGARVAMPLTQLMGGSVGIAGFVGVGGGAVTATDTLRAKSIIPAGLAIGYRRAVGAGGRGFSLYADPNYQYQSGTKSSKGYFRFGAGLDAGITSRFGVTLGLESGANAAAGVVGPRGSTFGVGVSMKLGR